MPDPEKLHQVAALTAAGKSVRQIAPEVGLSHATVNNYQHLDEARQLIEGYRTRITARLSQLVADKVMSDHAESMSLKELIIPWGIAMDKHDRASAPSSDGIKITINIDNRSVNVEPGT